MTLLTIGDERHTIRFDTELGARAISWKFDACEVLASPTSPDLFGGNYVMAPWAGRIEDASISYNNAYFPQPINSEPWALHGSTPFNEPTIVELTDSRVVFEHDLDSELPSWPRGFVVRHSWEIDKTKLITEIVVTTSGQAFPVVAGWHPWFLRTLSSGHSSFYGLDASGVFEVNDSKIVTGKLNDVFPGPWDDAFLVPDGKAFIEWDQAFRIDIETNSQFFVVYDKQAEYVCIEPQSGPPNGNNLDSPDFHYVVTPSKPLVLQATWSFSKHP